MTSMDGTDGAILKTDSQGWMRTPPARRESLLDEFEQSGLSGAKFAELSGIKYQTFANWLQKRRRPQPVEAQPQIAGGRGDEHLELRMETQHGGAALNARSNCVVRAI